jgi:hypothetical protein
MIFEALIYSTLEIVNEIRHIQPEKVVKIRENSNSFINNELHAPEPIA